MDENLYMNIVMCMVLKKQTSNIKENYLKTIKQKAEDVSSPTDHRYVAAKRLPQNP